MKQFPSHMKFRYPWRSYQLKVLEGIKEFMHDRKLHIVAPPGSGKTVLGWKVAHFLNQPVLILSPSIAIRNQWRDRLVHDFLQGEQADWITFDLYAPNFVTITTYQALHLAYKQDRNICQHLADSGIRTIIVDECHHLQKAWWKSLIEMARISTAQVVALTATPPYDVSGVEWSRYQELCGEVDIEINVAELVKEKNLCPHQDYIYFSLPDEEEQHTLYKFYGEIKELTEFIRAHDTFLDLLKQHPFLQDPETHLELIYQQPSYFSALMIVLQGMGKVIPVSAIGIIGADEASLPKLNLEWLELFLQGLLYHDEYFKKEAHQAIIKPITQRVHRLGVIEQGKVKLQQAKKIDKILRSSRSKFKSIKAIVEKEQEQLQSDLRLVILTDYIRKEVMPKNELDIKPIHLLGVVPIFEYLRKEFPVSIELGILSGSLIIIPTYSKALFNEIIKNKKLSEADFTTRPLIHDSNYLEVTGQGKAQQELVAIITELFSQGGIHVLIGTKALLGEGWDAPAINTLILASSVGSYVSSNQIRGRAIRIQKGNSEKTANIWHLVCAAPETTDGGSDFQILQRRFKSFYGLGLDQDDSIENGLDRLNLPDSNQLSNSVSLLNQKMLEHAKFRGHLKNAWLQAIEKGQRMIAQIDIPKQYAPSRQKVVKLLFDKTRELLPISFNHSIQRASIFLILSASILSFLYIQWPDLLKNIALSLLSTSLVFLVASFRFLRQRFNTILQLQKQFKWLSKNWLSLSLYAVAASLFVGGIFFYFDKFMGIAFLGILGVLHSISFMFPNQLFKNWIEYEQINDVRDHLYKVALTVLISLKDLNFIDKNIPNTALQLEQQESDYTFYLKNVSEKDQATFLKAFREVNAPIDNPRYLINKQIQYERQMSLDIYHAVPQVIGKRKEDAALFLSHWRKYVGKAELIFTRRTTGRLELVKAKTQGLVLGEPIKSHRSWR